MGLTERLHKIGVTDPGAMMPLTAIKRLILKAGEDPDSVLLSRIRENTQGHNRLPIIDATGRAVFIAHRSTIDTFIANQALNNVSAAALEQLTIENMKADALSLYETIKAMAFVGRGASIADAKRAMDSVRNCRDVFVTESGNASEPIIGWVSNIDITRLSRAE